VFEYFPTNYTWNLAVMAACNGGGIISEIDDACRPLIEAGRRNDAAAQESWMQSWMKVAERVGAMALAEEDRGWRRSAGRKYWRAAVYAFVAERLMSSLDARRDHVYGKALDYFRKAVGNLKHPVEFVEVPYQDTSLPALFVKAEPPVGESRTPCMLHFDGLDLLKELLYLRGSAEELRVRGISVLIVDHPGVGEALRRRGLKAFPETEVPAKACVDYLERRADVDAARIGIVANSLGGYYAARAAAFEKRLKCCVLWGALFDFGERLERRSELSVSHFNEHLRWVFGGKDDAETLAICKRLTLDGVVDKITCPLLVIHGENDRQVPVSDALKTYRLAVNSPKRELKVFTLAEGGAEHCQIDNVANYQDVMANWTAEALDALRL
jgi:dienelactone hydrolase